MDEDSLEPTTKPKEPTPSTKPKPTKTASDLLKAAQQRVKQRVATQLDKKYEAEEEQEKKEHSLAKQKRKEEARKAGQVRSPSITLLNATRSCVHS